MHALTHSQAPRAARAAALILTCVAAGSGCAGKDAKTAKAPSTTTTPKVATTPAADSTSTSGSMASKADQSYSVKLVKGQPSGGPRNFKAKVGDRVMFDISSDEAHSVHLHGYDVESDVEAGGAAMIEITANDSGSFEIEVEDTGTLIGNLEVS